MALTDKQKDYARNKIAGMSNKEAALAAGYSPNIASVVACKLNNNIEVVRLMNRLGGQENETTEAMKMSGYTDPKDFLMQIINDTEEDTKLRLDAAKTLMPYMHGKVADMGKKESQVQEAAEIVQKGRYAPMSASKH